MLVSSLPPLPCFFGPSGMRCLLGKVPEYCRSGITRATLSMGASFAVEGQPGGWHPMLRRSQRVCS